MQMLDVWKKTCTRTCAPRLLDCFFVCGDIRLNMATLASANMATLASPRLSILVATLASVTMQNVAAFASITLYVRGAIRLSSYAKCGDIRLSNFVY